MGYNTFMASFYTVYTVMLFFGIVGIVRGVQALRQTDEEFKATYRSRLRSNAKFDGARSEEEIERYIKNWKDAFNLGRRHTGVVGVFLGTFFVIMASVVLFVALPRMQIAPVADSVSWQDLASQARDLPKEQLEQDIDMTYKEVSARYDEALAVKLDAYLYIYTERYPESQRGTSLRIEILNKFGPCFGILEGKCRE